MIDTHALLLLFAGTNTALVAGLFYSWSCGITQGLGKLNDVEYINAMQAINRAIQRPWFFLSFMGTLVLLPAAAWVYHGHEQAATYHYLLAASVIYATGVFGVTVSGNVPLNNMLDGYRRGGPPGTAMGMSQTPSAAAERSQLSEEAPPLKAQGATAMRNAFESRWNRLNNTRTVCAIATLVCTILACIVAD